MKSARWRIVLCLTIFLSFSGGAAWAQGRGKAPGKDAHAGGDQDDRRLIFSDGDRRIIREWCIGHRENLPPGLAKRDRLPPGLEKQLVERGHLPPGLEKRVEPFPDELERRLPRLPVDYRRVILSGRIILMNRRTSEIMDIFRIDLP